MELIYAGLLLHKAGKEINEANVKKVVEAAGLHVNEGKIKALIAALDGVNIDEAIKTAAMPVATSSERSEKKEAKKEEKKEEVKEETAAAGLGALFG